MDQQQAYTRYQPPEQYQQQQHRQQQQQQVQAQGRPLSQQVPPDGYRRQSSYGAPLNGPTGPDPRGLNSSTASVDREGSPVPLSPIGGPGGNRPYPSGSRHSPAPSGSNASFHARDSSTATSRPTSQIPPSASSRSLLGQSTSGQPQTIAGEPLHDLSRAVALLKSSKFYAEGKIRHPTSCGPLS